MIRDPLKGHSAAEFIRLKWKKFLKPELRNRQDDVWQVINLPHIAEKGQICSYFDFYHHLNDHDFFQQALWRSALAELFGTAIFVFFGTGAAVAVFNNNAANLLAFDAGSLVLISMAFGFGLTVVIYSVGEISGGHINPAVTFATLMTGRLSLVRAAIYWVRVRN
jgi:hypothetical protein